MTLAFLDRPPLPVDVLAVNTGIQLAVLMGLTAAINGVDRRLAQQPRRPRRLCGRRGAPPLASISAPRRVCATRSRGCGARRNSSGGCGSRRLKCAIPSTGEPLAPGWPARARPRATRRCPADARSSIRSSRQRAVGNARRDRGPCSSTSLRRAPAHRSLRELTGDTSTRRACRGDNPVHGGENQMFHGRTPGVERSHRWRLLRPPCARQRVRDCSRCSRGVLSRTIGAVR